MSELNDKLDLIKLKGDVENIRKIMDAVRKDINGLRIDYSSSLISKKPIAPSVGCKVAYDENGLILESMKLAASDIPDISIYQVTGLKDILDNIPDESYLSKIHSDIKNSIPKRSDNIAGTATKINYDKNGFVVSGADLTADDIPNLPMSKIEGLPDLIDIINNMNTPVFYSNEESVHTKAGTYTKVSVDTNGRVTNGGMLTVHDLPNEFITRFNEIESIIPSLASQKTIDSIVNSITKKVTANNEITPGTYTKVHVDSKGLVTGGEKLSKSDLPEIGIDDISGLKKVLNGMAKYDDILDINNTISTLMSSVNSNKDMINMRNEIKNKASSDEVVRLNNELEFIRKTLGDIQTNMADNNLVMRQLHDINSQLSVLSGRISVLERK